MSNVTVIDHPLARAALTVCRDANTPSGGPFARQMARVGRVLAPYALAGIETDAKRVQTPLEVGHDGVIQHGKVALVPILRAGKALEQPFADLLERYCVWDLGLRRNEQTLKPEQYLNRIPERVPAVVQHTIVLEIMLATGGSSVHAVDILKERGATKITFVCVVSAPEGIRKLSEAHPDVDIFTVAVDERLTTMEDAFPPGYIVPGLGDAGRRLNDSAE
ncbi:uracil phosphoribosyltransferase [Candidatus Uhrbacteria bacterium]|nr:uracil phosphoribosyltransferase [Candidatus Uhrbacteria bacterium]